MFDGIFQPFHLLVILVIALLIFGPGKLSDVGNSLGKAIRGLKKALNDPLDMGKGNDDGRSESKDDEKKPPSP